MLALAAATVGTAGATTRTDDREGGILRLALAGVDYLDPALSYSLGSWALLDTTCARLMTYPDKPSPEGLRVVPEVAVDYPRISPNRKTYTFTLRPGFRFSDGTPVRASAFARAINRTFAPGSNPARRSTPASSQAPPRSEQADRRLRPVSSHAETRSSSDSHGPSGTSRPRRRCRSSVPFHRTCRRIPRGFEPSTPRVPTSSRTIGPASGSRSDAIPITEAVGRTMSTGSTSSCVSTDRQMHSTASSAATQTGPRRSRRTTSNPDARWPRSTVSTSRASSCVRASC